MLLIREINNAVCSVTQTTTHKSYWCCKLSQIKNVAQVPAFESHYQLKAKKNIITIFTCQEPENNKIVIKYIKEEGFHSKENELRENTPEDFQ